MPNPSSLDQVALMQLWKLAQDVETALGGQKVSWKHVYIRTCMYKGEQALEIKHEDGFFHWLMRGFNKQNYVIKAGSSTATLLKKLHDDTADRDEKALFNAVTASSIPQNGMSMDDIVVKIKIASRVVNQIIQHTMERKVENALEKNQEGIKLFFSTLFLPNWGLADARRAEMIRAQEEFSRAQEAATNKFIGIVEKVQAYLDAATAQLNLAMTQKEEAEQLLQQARGASSLENLQLAAQKAKECELAAENAVQQGGDILKQADSLVKAKEAEAKQPILNFTEVEEFKKFREIVNVVGEAAEYAQSAKNAATQVVQLATKQGL